MKKIIYIILISLLSLSLISCASSDESESTQSTAEEDTNDNDTNEEDTNEEDTNDTIAPTLTEVTAVTTPTNDTTPDYIFGSTEAGTITFGGSCTSSTTSASQGNNVISFRTLSEGSYSDCTIKVTDSSGNVSSTLSVSPFTISTGPSVSFVSSSTSNGTYGVGENITVTVTFDDNVTVDTSSGTPRIELETGSTDKYANYSSGSPSAVLSFLYSVQSGDNSSDLDYKAINSLSANGGTVRDNMSNNATFALASPGTANSLGANKAIVIDGIAPTVDNVSATNNDWSYGSSDTINITVTFSETVFVSGTPRLELETGSTDRYATYSSGNGSSVLTFNYVIQSGDNSTDLEYKSTSSLSTNGGSIKDFANNNATLTLPAIGASGSLGFNKDLQLIPKWSQQAYIKAANNGSNHAFGISLALNNNTLVVGAQQSGAVFVYVRDGSTWTQQEKLFVSATNTFYGWSVDIDGDTIVVGERGSGAGAVYVYKRSGTSWSQEAKISASNGESGDNFGDAVVIENNTLVVGAFAEKSTQDTITNGTSGSTNNDGDQVGAVYVYTRSGSTWTQQAYIKAANPDDADRFGQRLTLSGDTLAVGVPEEDSSSTTTINGNTASSDNNASAKGAVYVYKRSGNNWSQEAYIKAATSEGNAYFGYSVSLDTDTLAIGAYGDLYQQTFITNGPGVPSTTGNGTGAVFVYKRTGSNWAQEAYIKTPTSVHYALGHTVSLDNNTLASGTWLDYSDQRTISMGASTATNRNYTNGAGAVYIFSRSGVEWSQHAYIKSSNLDELDQFGAHSGTHGGLSVDGDTVVVGAHSEDSNQTTITNGSSSSSNNSNSGSGAVYVYLSE